MVFWISKDTNKQSEYTIFIAFTQQQWLHERASTIRFTTYIPCVVKCSLLTLATYIVFQRRVSAKLAAG